MLTAYAQTELGVGSDVRSLGTTATWDQSTKMWDLHTPNIKSYKWWPGGLGHTASWAMVFCNVIVENESQGVYPFFVQIRDMLTYKNVSGVKTGDVGPKWGYSYVDNGFLCLDHLMVSKKSLMGRFAGITPDGKFKTKGNPKLMYSGMLDMRSRICYTIFYYIAQASLIALRYSNVRTQFQINKKGKKILIINYQTQKAKIYPVIAKVYASLFSGFKIADDLNKHKLNVTKEDFSLMGGLHINLCITKSVFTQWLAESQIEMLQACGGHGYLVSSGIPALLSRTWVLSIFEGENNLL